MPLYVHFYRWTNRPPTLGGYPKGYKEEYAFQTSGPFVEIYSHDEYVVAVDAEGERTYICEVRAEKAWDYGTEYIEKSYDYHWEEAEGYRVTTSKNPPLIPR